MKKLLVILGLVLCAATANATTIFKKTVITPFDCVIKGGAEHAEYVVPWSIGFQLGHTGYIDLWCPFVAAEGNETVYNVYISYADSDWWNNNSNNITATLTAANQATGDVGQVLNNYGYSFDPNWNPGAPSGQGWQFTAYGGWSRYSSTQVPFTIYNGNAYYFSVSLTKGATSGPSPLFKSLVVYSYYTF